MSSTCFLSASNEFDNLQYHHKGQITSHTVKHNRHGHSLPMRLMHRSMRVTNLYVGLRGLVTGVEKMKDEDTIRSHRQVPIDEDIVTITRS